MISRLVPLVVVVSLLSCWILPSSVVAASSSSSSSPSEGNECERLQDTLTYTQEKAPRDLSSVFPVVVEKINRVLDGVVDVHVEWTGAELHGRVGEHIIECTVTRLFTGNKNNDTSNDNDNNNNNKKSRMDESGREVTSHCFHVPFTILDTDECKLPLGHSMRHICPPSSVCVNTDGSYECSCPRLSGGDGGDLTKRGPWELSFSSSEKTSCASSPSTIECCSTQARSTEGKRCRERFHCPIDPCGENHDCATSAKCVRAKSPNLNNDDQKGLMSSSLNTQLYTCQCPAGLMGNGKACRQGIDPPPQPKVMFDKVTPTALTLQNNYYCGCTKPRVDACSGFPPCQEKHEICTVSAATDNKPVCDCKKGYVRHDEYGCVDVNPPELILLKDPRGEKILRLKQGDEYREHMVDIKDENAEDYLRSLKVTYSQPLPRGCILGMRGFDVNYTVAMPWATPPDVTVTRQVIIEDIDECSILLDRKELKKYEQNCPQLIPRCDTAAGSECHNTNGSYTCQCPAQTIGDGFLKSAKFDDSAYPAPSTFKGGTSCVDTSKPVITVQGPNPKIFRVAKCGGLNGVMSPYSRNNQNDDEKEKLTSNQRFLYLTDIKEMILATAGAELCATYENPDVNASDCVKAIDRTYKGKVDLSDRVIVGDPVQKAELHWVVPYDVKDDAGNQAATIYRDVMVEEVNLAKMEKKIREEVISDEKRRTKRAIDNAVREERKKWDADNRASNNRSRRNTAESAEKTCPACSPCVCPDTDVVNAATCSVHCNNMSSSCRRQPSDESYVIALLSWLEDTVPVELPPSLIIAFLFFVLFYVSQWILALIFNPKVYTNYDYGNYGSINDGMVLATHPEPRQLVPAQRNSDTTNYNHTTYGRPPSASLSTTTNHLQNERHGGAFFSPGSQLGSPPPSRNNLHNSDSGNNHVPTTPAAAAAAAASTKCRPAANNDASSSDSPAGRATASATRSKSTAPDTAR
mmetsp:Transcript_27160/g.31150  ORF Transcript_27160/g.31150 Transcript_27160/m.31150 type:complete len:976 (+) Transcript_27160:75-3002(+)